jgi:adenylosuccinate lyase
MLALVRSGLPRQRAYELVQKAALASLSGGGEFRALLAADPDIAGRLTPLELDAAFDLEHHLRHVGAIYRRVFGETPP